MVVYIYGQEALAEIGVEAVASYGTAVTATIPLTYLRRCVLNVDEGAQWGNFIGGGTYRKASQSWKGKHITTGTLTFWLPNDMDATVTEAWLIKLGLDGFNVAHSGSSWVIPNTGTSIYGGLTLPSFTLVVGHNKTGAIEKHTVAGCVVDTMTITAKEGEPVEFVIDFIAQDVSMSDTGAFTGVTRSIAEPLTFANCLTYYADDGTQTARTDITEMIIKFSNNLIPNYDLSSTTPPRALTSIIPGKQVIDGSMTVNHTTTSGMDLFDALLNDASAPFVPTAGTKKKEVELRIGDNTNPTTEAIYMRLRNAIIKPINLDIDPSTVQKVTVPFEAQYYHCEIKTTDSTAPTNWDDQS